MTRGPYRDTARKLLLSFDVGTTFSGVSYSVMDPGEVPEIRTVTRFPEQVQSGGDCKIPSILYYDRHGAVKAVGSEAVREGIEGIAQENGWTKVEWFKLHLRPKTGSMSLFDGPAIPPLAVKQGIVKVFADYIKYLYDCSKSYIKETHANGPSLWQSVEKTIEYVFTHPNGWEGPQQNQMRRAAVKAGLITDDEKGHARISFVTEGEASLHYCINSGLSTQAIQRGEGIVVVDAGGGTIDISSYRGQDGKFEEIAASQCAFQGSVFVTNRAKAHLEDFLRGSAFEEDIPFIADRFDKRTKHAFRSDTEPQFIKFASPRENDAELGIRFGQLKLEGLDVATFFQSSIDSIVDGVRGQRNESRYPTKTVLLVGGFAASDWLYSQITSNLRDDGVEVYRPDGHTNKAVSDGGASYYLDHHVKSRVSKAAYGTRMFVPFDASKDTHLARRHRAVAHPVDGYLGFGNMFAAILKKDEIVEETREFRSIFCKPYNSIDEVGLMSVPIIRYRGPKEDDIWMDEGAGLCDTMCYVEVDARNFPVMLGTSDEGHILYRVVCEVILRFGLTELQAQVAWRNGGTESRTNAKVLYEPPI